MGIEVYQVRGDIMELVFDPREEDLRVGESLCVREKDTGRGLIVQIMEFRTATYPSMTRELLRLALAGNEWAAEALREQEGLMANGGNLASNNGLQPSEERNLKIAIAKIRRTLLPNGEWDQWDGWIPHRDVEVFPVPDDEMFRQCVELLGNPLELGYTLRGKPFRVEGRHMEKINIVTGVKGSGKSYLAKVILLELIERGAPCIVFDINREYIHLPRHAVDPFTGKVLKRGIVHLKVGENLKMGLRQFGIQPFITLMTKYGLPEVSAVQLENRLYQLFAEADALERKRGRPYFLSLDHLIELSEQGQLVPNEVVNNAIRTRLQAIKNTGIFASHPNEAIDFRREYQKIRDGGALVIDLSDLSYLARFGFVQALLEIIREICDEEILLGTNRFPFVFFEEAHLYISRNTISAIVTRSRHLGLTCFFITNMIGGLDESVLRQADNLWLLNVPFEDDVRHIAKSALTDEQTLLSYVKRLKRYHALALGNVTRGYPIIFRVKSLKGINTAGETKYFFQPTATLPETGFRPPDVRSQGDGGDGGPQPRNLFGEFFNGGEV